MLVRFIEILDNLDRALEAAELSYAGNPLIDGLILVRTQLLQTLQEEGLERIPVVGRPYDPGVGEAVETRPVDDPEQHHLVVKDLQRGYRLNGRVARAARVVVGEYQDAAATPEPPAEASPEAPAEAYAELAEAHAEPVQAHTEPPSDPVVASPAPEPAAAGHLFNELDTSLEEIVSRIEAFDEKKDG